MMELPTKTTTAERRIGSQRALSDTMRPPGNFGVNFSGGYASKSGWSSESVRRDALVNYFQPLADFLQRFQSCLKLRARVRCRHDGADARFALRHRRKGD